MSTLKRLNSSTAGGISGTRSEEWMTMYVWRKQTPVQKRGLEVYIFEMKPDMQTESPMVR